MTSDVFAIKDLDLYDPDDEGHTLEYFYSFLIAQMLWLIQPVLFVGMYLRLAVELHYLSASRDEANSTDRKERVLRVITVLQGIVVFTLVVVTCLQCAIDYLRY